MTTKKFVDQIDPNDVVVEKWVYSDPVEVTRELVNDYIKLSDDINPIHSENYKDATIPGFMCTVLMARYFPIVENWVMATINIRMSKPILVGSVLNARWKCIRKGSRARSFEVEVYVGDEIKQSQTFTIVRL